MSSQILFISVAACLYSVISWALCIVSYVLLLDCPSPPTLSDATIQENLINRTLGSMLTYNCVTGFEFPESVSSRQYRCNESKEWVSTNDSLSTTDAQLGCQREYQFTQTSN